MKNILVIDGQGGMLGKQIVEAVRKILPRDEITPVGIAIADSLLGEITPAMAQAVGQSRAKKVLIPVNKCNNIIVGVSDKKISELIKEAINQIEEISSGS